MKTTIQVQDAPAAIGPYSQAQVVRLHGGNRIAYTAGQVRPAFKASLRWRVSARVRPLESS